MRQRKAEGAMVRLELVLKLEYQVLSPEGADFIFNIHAAHTPHQTVSHERLVLSQPLEPDIGTDPATATRFMRLHADAGPLMLRYEATLELNHHRADPHSLQEADIRCLPLEVIPYVYPSRYCQS